jgi:hypothetical protein
MSTVTLGKHGQIGALGIIAMVASGVRSQAPSPAAVVTVQVPTDVGLYCPLSWSMDVMNKQSAPLAFIADAWPTVERLEDGRWRPAHGVNGVDCMMPPGICGPGPTPPTATLAVQERYGRLGELRDLAVLRAAGRYRLRAAVSWNELVHGALEPRRIWSDWVEFAVTARQSQVEQTIAAARESNSAVWRAYQDVMLSDVGVVPPRPRPELIPPGNLVAADALFAGGVSSYDRIIDSGITGQVLGRAYLIKALRLAGSDGKGAEAASALGLARAQFGTGFDVLYMQAAGDCLEARQACAAGDRARGESILQRWSTRSPRLHNIERLLRFVM